MNDPNAGMAHEAMVLPTNTALKIKIKGVSFPAEWRWTDTDQGDDCGICRMPFVACCVSCKFPGDPCPVQSGVCRHKYHAHCIKRWTEAPSNPNSNLCPLCRQNWLAKI